MTASIPRSPQHDELRAYLLDLYARCISIPAPPDKIMERFFRRRKKLGLKARGFLASVTYALLRKRYRSLLLYNWVSVESPRFEWKDPGEIALPISPIEEAAVCMMRWLVEDFDAPIRVSSMVTSDAIKCLETIWQPPDDEGEAPTRGKPIYVLKDLTKRWGENRNWTKNLPENLRDSAETSVSWELIERWKQRFGDEQGIALAKSMSDPAPLDIRVNTVRASRGELQSALENNGFASNPTPYSPHGLRLEKKGRIFQLDQFKEGFFELQDEASQLVSLALDPKPTWRVLDACSGGGGKSLHLGAMMKNRGDLFAHDIDEARLDPQRKRLKRSGLNNVRILEPNSAESHGPYDAVLIDAPCLGLGTLRRNPDMMWRGSLAERLNEMSEVQRECALRYAKLLKPGGILVYATCSFEKEETLEVCDYLLDSVPGLEPAPLAEPFGFQKIGNLAGPEDWSMTMLPSVHRTDGFFFARFRRKH